MADPVLILSPYFAPRPRIGAQRATKFVRHLPEFGIEPHVASLDEGWEGLSRFRLKRPLDRTVRRSGSALSASTGPDPLRWVDRLVPVDSWLPVMWWNRAEVVDFARTRGVRLVWSTGDPWSGHILARFVATALGVPWIADWRDPWTLCKVRNLDKPDWVRSVERHVEKSCMTAASVNTFTAAETARRYSEAYGIRTLTIHNAYDAIGVSAGEPPPGKDPVELVFFGRFRDLSPAEPVIRLLAASGLADRIRVVSFGPLPEADLELARRLNVDACFVTEAPIAMSEAPARLAKADMLLISTDLRRDEIIPAKLWDYLPMGRPVLSLAPNRDIDRILAQTGLALPGDAGTQLATYVLDPASRQVRPDIHAIAAYNIRNTTLELAKLMKELIDGH